MPVQTGDDARLRQRLLRSLDELVQHFSRAPVFEAESDRALFLGRLGMVRAGWATADLGLILSPEGTPWPPPREPDEPEEPSAPAG